MKSKLRVSVPINFADIHYNKDFNVSRRWYYDSKKYLNGTLSETLTLNHVDKRPFKGPRVIPLLRARDRKGNIIELVDCWSLIAMSRDSLWGSLSPDRQKREMILYPGYVMFAKEYQSGTRKVSSIQGHILGMSDWLGVNTVTFFDYDNLQFNGKSATYSIKLLGGAVTLEAYNESKFDYQVLGIVDKFVARSNSSVRLSFSSASMEFQQAAFLFSNLEKFTNFVFGTSYRCKVFACSLAEYETDDAVFAKPYSPVRTERANRDQEPYTFPIFTVANLENPNRVSEILDLWLEYCFDFEDALETLSLCRVPEINEPIKFRLIISSIESLHRKFFEQTSVGLRDIKDDWSRRCERILSCIQDDQDRCLVESRLKYPDTMSLRSRLKDISETMVNYGLESLDKVMINKIVKTRNYYFHKDDKNEKDILKGLELSKANRLLTIFIKLIILKKIGLSDVDLESAAKNVSLQS